MLSELATDAATYGFGVDRTVTVQQTGAFRLLMNDDGYDDNWDGWSVQVYKNGTPLGAFDVNARDADGTYVCEVRPGDVIRTVVAAGDGAYAGDDEVDADGRSTSGDFGPTPAPAGAGFAAAGLAKGSLLGRVGAERLTWLLPDQEMSVRDTVGWGSAVPAGSPDADAGGVFVDRFDYSSFGVADASLAHDVLSGARPQPRYGYAGQELDAETGLIYMSRCLGGGIRLRIGQPSLIRGSRRDVRAAAELIGIRRRFD